jgi:putative salt-induced outer membrane protein YdiY
MNPASSSASLLLLLALGAGLLGGTARADLLEFQDGDRYSGTIERITTNQIVLVTVHAGRVTVARSAVRRIVTAAPVTMAIANGDRVTGRIDTTPDGALAINTGHGTLQFTNAAAVTTVWLTTAPDPTLPPPPPGPVWKHSLAFDLQGKSGNSRALLMGGAVDTVMSGPDTEFKLYAKGAYGKTDGSLSDHRLFGGTDFERRFTASHSWYVRDEALRDEVQGLRFRNLLSGGYGYYVFRQEARQLRLRSGLGYTYAAFMESAHTNATASAREDDSAISMDFGLRYRERIGKHLTWSTDLTFQPNVDDFANYYATHESALSIPLAVPNLTQEFGISHQYVSQPDEGKQKLDTTYFTRTRLAW